jgi:hypothetical protein
MTERGKRAAIKAVPATKVGDRQIKMINHRHPLNPIASWKRGERIGHFHRFIHSWTPVLAD